MEATLPANLYYARKCKFTLALLDYGSSDGLDNLIRNTFLDELNEGILTFGQTSAPAWQYAHAKNVAHRFSEGTLLCNLDADNIVTEAAHHTNRLAFESDINSLVHPTYDAFGGGYGRIAISRENFVRFGGYDERFQTWGYEDIDLVERARVAGLSIRQVDGSNVHYLYHGDGKRMFAGYADREKSHDANKRLSELNTRVGNFRANAGQTWGSALVVRNFWEEIQL